MAAGGGGASFDALLARVAGVAANGGGTLTGGEYKMPGKKKHVPLPDLRRPFSRAYLEDYNHEYFHDLHTKHIREKFKKCRTRQPANNSIAMDVVLYYYESYLEPYKNHLLDRIPVRGRVTEAQRKDWLLMSNVTERFMRRSCAIKKNDEDGTIFALDEADEKGRRRRRRLNSAVRAWEITLENALFGELRDDQLEARDREWKASFEGCGGKFAGEDSDDAEPDDKWCRKIDLPAHNDLYNPKTRRRDARPYENQFRRLCSRVHTLLIRAKKAHAQPAPAAQAGTNRKWMAVIEALHLENGRLNAEHPVMLFKAAYSQGGLARIAHRNIDLDPPHPEGWFEYDAVYRILKVKTEEPEAAPPADAGEEDSDGARVSDGEASSSDSQHDAGNHHEGEEDNIGVALSQVDSDADEASSAGSANIGGEDDSLILLDIDNDDPFAPGTLAGELWDQVGTAPTQPADDTEAGKEGEGVRDVLPPVGSPTSVNRGEAEGPPQAGDLASGVDLSDLKEEENRRKVVSASSNMATGEWEYPHPGDLDFYDPSIRNDYSSEEELTIGGDPVVDEAIKSGRPAAKSEPRRRSSPKKRTTRTRGRADRSWDSAWDSSASVGSAAASPVQEEVERPEPAASPAAASARSKASSRSSNGKGARSSATPRVGASNPKKKAASARSTSSSRRSKAASPAAASDEHKVDPDADELDVSASKRASNGAKKGGRRARSRTSSRSRKAAGSAVASGDGNGGRTKKRSPRKRAYDLLKPLYKAEWQLENALVKFGAIKSLWNALKTALDKKGEDRDEKAITKAESDFKTGLRVNDIPVLNVLGEQISSDNAAATKQGLDLLKSEITFKEKEKEKQQREALKRKAKGSAMPNLTTSESYQRSRAKTKEKMRRAAKHVGVVSDSDDEN